MAKKKKRKQKHIVGTKELIFDVVSLLLIISFGIYIGFRSITYYSKETAKKKKEENTLAAAIINSNEITKSENGFRKSEDGYYFIGDVNNNYVKAFNRLFRIIEVSNDNSVKIVSQDNEATMIYGNDNVYENSNVYNWLNKSDKEHTGIYYDTIPGVKELLVKTSYCEGTLKDDKVNCKGKNKSDYFSILDVQDYLRAGSNKSYLKNGLYSFLLGKDEDDNPLIITNDATLTSAVNSEGYGVRVVMTLKQNALITGGDGSKDSPYVLNQEESNNNINKYVKLGDDLYQIYKEEGDILRIRKNDYLYYNGVYQEKVFNKGIAEFNLKNRNNIGYYLNNIYYYQIPYKDLLSDCKFDIGEISTDTSYSMEEIYKDVVTVKIGLLNMFDYNPNKEATDYYLINKTSRVGSMVKTYNKLGIIDDDKADSLKKIVPVMCINKSLIKEGNGDINNPYTLG